MIVVRGAVLVQDHIQRVRLIERKNIPDSVVNQVSSTDRIPSVRCICCRWLIGFATNILIGVGGNLSQPAVLHRAVAVKTFLNPYERQGKMVCHFTVDGPEMVCRSLSSGDAISKRITSCSGILAASVSILRKFLTNFPQLPRVSLGDADFCCDPPYTCRICLPACLARRMVENGQGLGVSRGVGVS